MNYFLCISRPAPLRNWQGSLLFMLDIADKCFNLVYYVSRSYVNSCWALPKQPSRIRQSFAIRCLSNLKDGVVITQILTQDFIREPYLISNACQFKLFTSVTKKNLRSISCCIMTAIIIMTLIRSKITATTTITISTKYSLVNLCPPEDKFRYSSCYIKPSNVSPHHLSRYIFLS